MIVRLLTEHHLEFLSLKGGCKGLSESTLVKMSNCWKSHGAAHIQKISQGIHFSYETEHTEVVMLPGVFKKI